MLTYLRALRAYVPLYLTCLLIYVRLYLTCLRAYVRLYYNCLHSYLHLYLTTYVLTCLLRASFTCLLAYMPLLFASVRPHVVLSFIISYWIIIIMSNWIFNRWVFFAIHLVLSVNTNSPIRKLLVSISQLFSGYLMLSTCQVLCLQIFDTAKKISRYMVWNEMKKTKWLVMF